MLTQVLDCLHGVLRSHFRFQIGLRREIPPHRHCGSNYQQRYTPFSSVHIRTGNLGIYLQDDWAPTSQLKLSLGLRLDHTANIGCTDDCYARMVQPWDSVAKGASVPYNQTIQTGLSKAFYDIPAFAAQPRLGEPTWRLHFSIGQSF